MASLYGKKISRKELAKRLGTMSQVAGVRLATLEDGMERGVRVAQVKTGGGLDFTVALSRGMDIYDASFNGRALGWLSPVGIPHPSFFEPEGLGWLKTFGGGLVTTCGLASAGAPSVDEDKPYGLHGRISHQPARRVSVSEDWVGDDYEMTIAGEVLETIPVWCEHLRLCRKITCRLGEARFFINDEVENFGYTSLPHMFLYHINVGYPVVDEGSRLLAPSLRYLPRDAAAQVEAEKWSEVCAPQEGFAERCYAHEVGADSDGRTTAALVNPNLDEGFAMYVNYQRSQLPYLTEWKMCAAGNYVIGIEPANCGVDGRSAHRQRGKLQFLEPGEKRQYGVEIGVLQGAEALNKMIENVKKMK
jgi:hypothetical protein